MLLSGYGDAPPEDVGGPGGFTEFLEIISNPAHEEHESMLTWAKSLWWKPFDFDALTRHIGGNMKRRNVMAATSNTVPDTIAPKKRGVLSDENARILGYMKSHPEVWGFVIVDEPFDYCGACASPARVCIDDNQANEIGIR